MEDIIKAKTYICDVIDYDRDIKPFPLVKIYSGVGSGKSHFAAQMITGSKEYGIPEQNVLIITSRRAKVEETLKEMGVNVTERITRDGNLNFEVYQDGEAFPYGYEKYQKAIKYSTVVGEHTYLSYNKSVVCTNAYISAHLRNVYDPKDAITHIWNKFDTIIIDEVHSLVTDATYQPATFDVLALIQEYLKLSKNKQLQECACKHMILMTGTPDPFEAAVQLNFPEKATNELYLFDQCENVVPQKVILIDDQSTREKITELLSCGQKVIYFSNHTMTESAVREKFSISDSINIGVSFSNEEKRKNLTKGELDKIEAIETSLANESHIPDDIQFFVTTSRNKEGININNTDFQHMFIETHLMYDAVQMAGRVRSGIDILYVISNAWQFECKPNLTDIIFTKKVMVANRDYPDSKDEANTYLERSYPELETYSGTEYEERIKEIKFFVKYIEDRFDYVRYNVFTRKFEFFHIKENAEQMAALQTKGFNEALLSENQVFVEHWFQRSTVERELSLQEQVVLYLNDIIGPEMAVRLSSDELQQHLDVIRKILNCDGQYANSILHKVDKKFSCEPVGNGYILYYGDNNPLKKTKKVPMRKRRNH